MRLLRTVGRYSQPEPLTWRRRLWLFIRALIVIIFGLVLAILTRITLFLFIAAFGTLALIDGIITLSTAIGKRRQNPRWWLSALTGIVELVIAGLAFFASGWTKMTLIYIFAIWAVFVGVTQMLSFFRTRYLRADWLSLLPALLSVIVGGYLLLKPSPNVVRDARLIGLYAIIFGILTLVQAVQPRRPARTIEQPPETRHKMTPY